jgi:hypothetical protein
MMQIFELFLYVSAEDLKGLISRRSASKREATAKWYLGTNDSASEESTFSEELLFVFINASVGVGGKKYVDSAIRLVVPRVYCGS